MIWCTMFFSYFLLKVKSFFFFSGLLEMNSYYLFMTSICPLVLLLILNLISMNLSSTDFILNSFSFLFIVMILFVCFLLVNSYHFILSLEMCVMPMIFLIFSYSKSLEKIISVFFMFLTNILGSIPFMMYFSSQNLNLFSSFSTLNFCLNSSNSIMVFFFFSLIMICKIPLFLFHFWLTKAHVSASGSCSMILASLMLKLGTFGLYKFSNFFLKVSSFNLSFLLSVSTWGSLIILTVMTRFFDVKYLIACSSIIHMSSILPLICFNQMMGVMSSIFMMVGHGLVSFILFYLVSVFYEISQNRSSDLNKSLESSNKVLSMLVFIFMFLNLGVPPFVNFFSELFIFVSFLKISLVNSIILIVLMIIPIMFCMNLITNMIFGKKINWAPNESADGTLEFTLTYIIFLFILPFIFF